MRSLSRLIENRLAQALLIGLFWIIGEAVARTAGLPFPGSVVGLALVLALLASGVIKPASMRRGAQLFMGEMLLFFIPAVMAVIDHHEFLGLLGLKVIAIILVGTVTVMVTTALVVEFVLHLAMARSAARDHA